MLALWKHVRRYSDVDVVMLDATLISFEAYPAAFAGHDNIYILFHRYFINLSLDMLVELGVQRQG